MEALRQDIVHLGVQVQRLPQLYQELEQLKCEAAEADKVRAQVVQLQEGVQQLDGLRHEQELLQQQVEQVRLGLWVLGWVCADALLATCSAYCFDAPYRSAALLMHNARIGRQSLHVRLSDADAVVLILWCCVLVAGRRVQMLVCDALSKPCQEVV